MPVIDNIRISSDQGQKSFVASTKVSSATQIGNSTGIANPSITSVTGENIGVGIGMFAGLRGDANPILDFKTFVAGTGLYISTNGQEITLTATGQVATFANFTTLHDVPSTIMANAVLIGSSNGTNLVFSPSANSAGTVFTYTGNSFVWQVPPLQGIQTITGDAAILANISGSVASLQLATTGVLAGTYTAASIVVDAQGRVRAATNNLGLAANATLSGMVTGTGPLANIVTVLANSGVTAGSYTKITVDATGRAILGANLASLDVTTALGFTPANPANAVVQTATLTGAVNGTGPLSNIVTTFVPTGVTPGTYAKAIVDATGRVTGGFALTSTDITTALGYTAANAAQQLIVNTVISGAITGSGPSNNVVTTLTPNGVTPGTYSKVVVNATGLVSVGTNLASLDVTTALGYVPVNPASPPPYTVIMNGDVIGNGIFSNVATVLSPTGVAAGTYTKLVVNTSGRVTGGGSLLLTDVTAALGYLPLSPSNPIFSANLTGSPVAPTPVSGDNSNAVATTAFVVGAIANTPGVKSITITGTGITVANGTITNTGTIALSLSPTGVTPGTYAAPTIIVSADGRITNVAATPPSGVTFKGALLPSTTLQSVTVANVAVSALLLGDVPAYRSVLQVSVGVTQAYTNNATMTIGSANVANSLMAASHVDLTTIGTYVVSPLLDFSNISNSAVYAFPILNGSITGNAAVMISYI